MVWIVSEAAYGAEITDIIGVAATEERGRELADEHWTEQAKRVGSKGNHAPLLWDEQGSYYMFNGRRFSDPYQVEEFPVL